MTSGIPFVPKETIIQSITNANPGVVTTTTNHGYNNGLYVRLVFPANFGMQQVANQVYLITKIDNTSFSINQDTTNFEVFSIPLGSTQSPQSIPVGEVATTLINLVKNNLTPIGGN